MTRLQLAVKIRDNLSDLGITFYNINDVNESIQDAYDEIAIYSECIEKYVDVTLANLIAAPGGAKPWVNMRTLIPDYYRPIAILNQTTRQFIEANFRRYDDAYKLDWQNQTTGTVHSYIINGPEWISLPNSYIDSSHKPLRVFYKASAPTLTHDSNVFRILTKYQVLLEQYCTADLLEQNEEFVKAQTYWNSYEIGLEEYKSKILLLSKADRIFAREI